MHHQTPPYLQDRPLPSHGFQTTTGLKKKYGSDDPTLARHLRKNGLSPSRLPRLVFGQGSVRRRGVGTPGWDRRGGKNKNKRKEKLPSRREITGTIPEIRTSQDKEDPFTPSKDFVMEATGKDPINRVKTTHRGRIVVETHSEKPTSRR